MRIGDPLRRGRIVHSQGHSANCKKLKTMILLMLGAASTIPMVNAGRMRSYSMGSPLEDGARQVMDIETYEDLVKEKAEIESVFVGFYKAIVKTLKEENVEFVTVSDCISTAAQAARNRIIGKDLERSMNTIAGTNIVLFRYILEKYNEIELSERFSGHRRLPAYTQDDQHILSTIMFAFGQKEEHGDKMLQLFIYYMWRKKISDGKLWGSLPDVDYKEEYNKGYASRYVLRLLTVIDPECANTIERRTKAMKISGFGDLESMFKRYVKKLMGETFYQYDQLRIPIVQKIFEHILRNDASGKSGDLNQFLICAVAQFIPLTMNFVVTPDIKEEYLNKFNESTWKLYLIGEEYETFCTACKIIDFTEKSLEDIHKGKSRRPSTPPVRRPRARTTTTKNKRESFRNRVSSVFGFRRKSPSGRA